MHRLELIAIMLICGLDAGLLALAHLDADKPKFADPCAREGRVSIACWLMD